MIPSSSLRKLFFDILVAGIDPAMTVNGFKRSKSLAKYVREFMDCRQEVELSADFQRRDGEQVGVISGDIRIYLPSVNNAAESLLVKEGIKLPFDSDMTVAVSFGDVGATHSYVEWRVDSFDNNGVLTDELSTYVRDVVIPFVNLYRTRRDLIEGAARRDPRLPTVHSWFILVAAAHLAEGDVAGARRVVLDAIPNRPQFTRRYTPLLEHLNALVETTD